MIPTRASLRLHVHCVFFFFFFFFTYEEEQITDNGTTPVRYRLWPKAKRKEKKEYFYSLPQHQQTSCFGSDVSARIALTFIKELFLLLEKCQGNPGRNVRTKTTGLLVLRERIKIKRWPSKNTVNHWKKKKKFQQLPFHIEKFPCRKVHTLQPHSRKLTWFSGFQVEMSCCTTFWPENWKIWLRNWLEIKLCCWSSECSSMQLCAVGFVRKPRSSWYGPFFFVNMHPVQKKKT